MRYLIQYKIATVAKLVEPFTHKGFEFSSYSDWWKSDAWVASRVIHATRATEARKVFVAELRKLIDEFSTISQCAFRFVLNPYFIYKLDENLNKEIYIWHVRPVDPVGLQFDKEEIDELSKFEKIKNKSGLYFLSESANATTFYTNLVMLISALEGFAGEVTTNGKIFTDKNELKRILGQRLYEKLYRYETGLRHKLLHGKILSLAEYEGLTEEVYEAIRAYLIKDYDINISEDVVHPQRNFHGNYEAAGTFMAFKDKPLLDLREIEKAMNASRDGDQSYEISLFTYSGENHERY